MKTINFDALSEERSQQSSDEEIREQRDQILETQSLNQNMQTTDSKLAKEITELAETNQFQNTLTKDKLKSLNKKGFDDDQKLFNVIGDELD